MQASQAVAASAIISLNLQKTDLVLKPLLERLIELSLYTEENLKAESVGRVLCSRPRVCVRDSCLLISGLRAVSRPIIEQPKQLRRH
jgi:hypothetical protein